MPFGNHSNSKKSPFVASRTMATATTGVPLSERFKVLNETSKKQPAVKLNIGGFGYGAPKAPAVPAPSIFSLPRRGSFGLDTNSYLQQTLAATTLLAKQTNALLLRSRLMTRGADTQRLAPQFRPRQPVKTRVGNGINAQNNRVIGGGVTKQRAFNNQFRSPQASGSRPTNQGTRGGFHNKKGVVVRRGGGGAPPAARKGQGISPLNRPTGASGKNWFGAVRSKEDLDSELDNYMKQAKNKPKVPKSKCDLDVELEQYMNARPARTSSATGTTPTADTEDVIMKDTD